MIDEAKIIGLIARPSTSNEGFRLLVESYQQSIYWHIRRLVVNHEDAEDVMQESFIQIYKYIYNFRGDSSLKTWIYRVVTNEVIRHYSKRRLTMESYDENSRLVEMFASSSDIDFSLAESRLQMALLSLPEKQRIVFNLRHFDDMSYEQIASIVGGSILTLRSNYHYAKQRVKEYILKNTNS